VKTTKATAGAAWSLSADLLSAHALVWLVSIGREPQLTSEAHLFFSDRYRRLAQFHRMRGRLAKASRLQTKADEHYRAAGGDGPPSPLRWQCRDRHDSSAPMLWDGSTTDLTTQLEPLLTGSAERHASGRGSSICSQLNCAENAQGVPIVVRAERQQTDTNNRIRCDHRDQPDEAGVESGTVKSAKR